ncbi:DsbA family protein [Albidovulum sediminicola]|uniref:DsbA family protein n=1 Tax=Albidovulum sediminicola TaxID=2984331 RepID=A0ABT2YZB1_9RHOB|nr:DsbA family protein [Defluviimonas sp. WL0075]MCV2864225.1 DsbA family protein [Defluviimonas sp. WL0075]
MNRLASALTLAATLAAAQPALAFDITAMSDAEREAFGNEVRGYLLAHPEVLVEVINELEQRNAQAQANGDKALIAANAKDIFDDGWSFVAGNPEGDITVVEFLDYRCGYCRKAHGAVSDLITSDGNIRFIVKEYPILGEQSVLASRFAIAARMVAGDEAYAKISAGFYETFRGDVTDAALRNFAEDLGIDAEAVAARMNDPEVTKIIEDNHLLAQRLQISGTPSFVIGDQLLRGYAPLEAMQGIVAEERS